MNKFLCGVSTLALISAAHAAAAQDTATNAAPAAEAAQEVIVTGTRQTGVRAADSAQPIEVVGAGSLTRTGSTDLAASLEQNVPSFNFNTSGGDIAALTVQAALRGLSPNDTLVLVNGHRRNGTSNLAVDGGSAFSGSATVDLSFIPIDSIDHVEVLTDGAAAQYGTDAIAGVVNIILKNSNHAGLIDGTGGAYYNGEGQSGDIQVNKGFDLFGRGFINFTLEQRYHDFSEVGLGDARFQNPDGSLLGGNLATGLPNSNVGKADNFPRENQLNGDPRFDLWNGFWNGGFNITNDIQAYTYGNYSKRFAEHYENYRSPAKVSGVTSTGTNVYPFPYGFDPREKINEEDYDATAGIKGQEFGFHWDLAGTYGQDTNQIYVVHSANAQLFPVLQAQSATPITNPQTSFFNGQFKSTELTLNLDVTKDFEVGLAKPLSVAVGAEQRHNTFSIEAGEPNSYFGAGAQSFDGYTPLDAGVHGRTNYAFYVDLANNPIEQLHLDFAGRYEHYSDFGDASVGKGNARYDFSPQFAIRGTFSTGFRAPTLAEEFYSGTNVSPYSAEVQLPPNSFASTVAGFGPLKPEESTSFEAGIVAHPMPHMQFTADYYNIHLRNRILTSGFIYGTNTIGGDLVTISQNVLNSIAARGVTLDSGLSYTGIALFANAANTRTEGLEATATYASDFGEFGHVDWSLGFNWNDTKITKLNPLPAADVNTQYGQTSILTPTALTALTSATPDEKAILQAIYSGYKFIVTLRETVYGPSEQFSANNSILEKLETKGITDLDVGYKLLPNLKLAVGAVNLFNDRPHTANQVAGGFPAGGGVVFNVPYGFSPYGVNGGYYYGRVTYSF